MATSRPPLTRSTTSPAVYCQPRDRPGETHGYAGGNQCRAFGSDGVPSCASPKPHSRYPTPPHTTSPPHSNASTPDSSDENMPSAASTQASGASYFPTLSSSRSPSPASPHVPIVTIRGSRSPTEDQRVTPEVVVSAAAYSLVAHLGSGFHPECITISAKKGNALVIVADRWDMEKDCRYEWVWQFDRDADMSSVHASLESGVLRVTVKRIPGYRLGNY